MKKIKYYVETTVFNFMFADDAPAKQVSTERFFQNWTTINGEMYISDIVNEEIGRAPEDIQIKLIQMIRKYNPIVLSINEETVELANKYIAARIIPERFKNDALHIAIAVVYNMDVIVSWNLEHIVKLRTKMGTEGINRMLGYKSIEIMTPEEVL